MALKKKNEEEIKGKVIPEITFDDEIVVENKPIIVEIEEEKLKSPIVEEIIIEEDIESPIVEEIIPEIKKEVIEENKDSKIIDTSKLSKEEIEILISNLGKSDYNFYRRTGFIINRQKK